MALPPTPAKQSMTTVAFWHLLACLIAICSGVTEYQPCSSILIPSSYLEKRSYLWNQYFSTTRLTPSSISFLLFWVWAEKEKGSLWVGFNFQTKKETLYAEIYNVKPQNPFISGNQTELKMITWQVQKLGLFETTSPSPLWSLLRLHPLSSEWERELKDVPSQLSLFLSFLFGKASTNLSGWANLQMEA